ncbi:MAG: 8-oxo-dGTP diphosphatase [Bacilli bacterium]|nr:8-oxo-dGTP diphosphatase [Bacilli bacterium]
MDETVLCYIKKDNRYLMLYRNKKANDPNAGKWMGVGGHIEKGETPDEAMKREIKEETGLSVKSYIFKGIATFVNNAYKERMYLYRVECFDGDLIECNEGELKFFTIDEIYNLNMWEGDRFFLPYIFGDEEYFEILLYYENDKYIKTERIK